ncbi:hypothetical protein ACFL4G_08025 [Thermodesulfobacteriota bacterium]
MKEIIFRLKDPEPDGKGGYMAFCPCHGDGEKQGRRSLHVTETKDDERVLLHCFAGCKFKDIAVALGLDNERTPEVKAQQIHYDYHDENGNLVYQVCRGSGKKFFQRKPDGKDGWIHRMKGVRRVPYHLPVVLKAEQVFIVEGEKDADRLASIGLVATTNPGGAGNWIKYSDTLNPPFKRKDVVILPDNDEPGRRHGQQVAEALHGLASSIKVVVLPDLPEKGDASDWLDVGHGKDELLELVESASPWSPPGDEKESAQEAPDIFDRADSLVADWEKLDHNAQRERLRPLILGALALDAIDLGVLKQTLTAGGVINKRGFDQAIKQVGQAQSDTDPELDELEDTKILHGAIDFHGEAMLLGFRLRGQVKDNVVEKNLYLYQDGDEWKTQLNKSPIVLNGNKYVLDPGSCPPWLKDRWAISLIRDFKLSPVAPAGIELFRDIESSLQKYLDLPSQGSYYMLAGWAVGTYLAHLFPAYPFLLFYGPKETGKSKTLEVLQHLCFNPIKVKGLTVAALGDTVEGMRGTVLVDQAEALHPDLVGILADSYKKSGGKRRVIQIVNGARSVLEFNTYGPKAFASTKNLDPDLLDRCCKIGMIRTSRALPDVEGWEDIWLGLRDQLYRWSLLNHPAVAGAFHEIPSTGNRWGELWRPLQAVLMALEVPEEIITETREAFNAGTAETKTELSNWEEALFQAVQDLVEGQPDGSSIESDTQTILSSVQEYLDGQKPESTKWIGDQISKFSLGTRGKRKSVDGHKRQTYLFEPQRIRELVNKYIREPENNPSSRPQGKIHSDINDSGMTGSKIPDASPSVNGVQLDLLGGTI